MSEGKGIEPPGKSGQQTPITPAPPSPASAPIPVPTALPPASPKAGPTPATLPTVLETVFETEPVPPPASRLERLAPPGGQGGLLFWAGLCAVLAATAFLFHARLTKQEQANREAQEQLQIFVAENQKLRAEVDRLQTELAREGSLLRSREQILRETTESLQQVQTQADQAAKAAETLRQSAETLRTALDKAIPNDPDIQIVTNQPSGGTGGSPGVVVRLGSGLLFDPGQVVLNEKGKALMKTVAAALAAQAPQTPFTTLAVEGHLDSTPLKTMTPADMTSRRASEVALFLTENAPTLAAARPIAAQGYADTHPLVPNDGPDHAKNRRIDMVLTAGQ